MDTCKTKMGSGEEFLIPSQVIVNQTKKEKINEAKQMIIKKWRKLRNKLLINHLLKNQLLEKKLLEKKLLKNIIKIQKWFRLLRSIRDLKNLFRKRSSTPHLIEFNNENEKKKKDLKNWLNSLPTIICQSNEHCPILRSKNDQCEFCTFPYNGKHGCNNKNCFRTRKCKNPNCDNRYFGNTNSNFCSDNCSIIYSDCDNCSINFPKKEPSGP